MAVDGASPGTAGASARNDAAARRASTDAGTDRGRSLLGRRPGRVRRRQPDAGAWWAKGAVGEERLGRLLDGLAASGAVSVLHDRRLTDSRANIDHVVVAPTGVCVVDAKRYSGRLDLARGGGRADGDAHLLVDGRDRTDRLVQGVRTQIAHVRAAHVRAALDPTFAQVDVIGALCFVDTRRRLGSRPACIDGVRVTWERDLRRRLGEDGPLDAAWRASIQHRLATSFWVAG